MRAAILGAAMAAIAATGAASAEEQCGSLLHKIGPYDYRSMPQDKRDTLERYHFTQDVEMLKRGESTVKIGLDLTFVLKAIPNHPRALHSMAELAQREKKERPRGSQYTVTCWFERAIRFRPDDGNVRLVFGVALLKSGERASAIEQLEKADQLLPHNANVHYNLGLAYFDAEDYAKALEHAKQAYELGFPLPGLRQKLERAGQWH